MNRNDYFRALNHHPVRGLKKILSGATAESAKRNGFDLNQPLETLDGDEVVVLTVNPGHPFPIVGEVQDHNADRCWLARWSTTGRYLGTRNAAIAHSLAWNVPGFKGIGLYQKGENFAYPKPRIADKVREIEARVPMSKRATTTGRWSGAKPGHTGEPVMTALGKTIEAIAKAHRANLNAGLSRIYADALSQNSHLTVAAIAGHVERLIDERRLQFPRGLGKTTFDELGALVRELSSNPGITWTLYR
jgi:hypothetical protein